MYMYNIVHQLWSHNDSYRLKMYFNAIALDSIDHECDHYRHSTHSHVIKLLQGSGSAPKLQVQQLLDENGG